MPLKTERFIVLVFYLNTRVGFPKDNSIGNKFILTVTVRKCVT